MADDAPPVAPAHPSPQDSEAQPSASNPEFTMDDPMTEISLEPVTKQIVEFTANEKCTLVWELRVVGWKVSYSAEFVPQRGYTILIQKSKDIAANDLPVVSDSFHISEPGKILLTIENPTYKKKKLLYRYKVVPSVA